MKKVVTAVVTFEVEGEAREGDENGKHVIARATKALRKRISLVFGSVPLDGNLKLRWAGTDFHDGVLSAVRRDTPVPNSFDVPIITAETTTERS